MHLHAAEKKGLPLFFGVAEETGLCRLDLQDAATGRAIFRQV